MPSTRPAILLGILFLGGCGFLKFTSNDTGFGTDTSSGNEGEGSSGEGEGEGSTADSGGTVDNCDENITPEDQTGDDCVTRTISCGDSFVSTTEDGPNNFDGEAYVDWFCTPTSNDAFEGGERVYELIHPGTGDVYINFDSPCTALSVFVMYWQDADTCPIVGNSVQECDTTTMGAPDSVRVWDNQENRYLIVVDSEPGDEGLFGLTVDCG